MLAIYLSSSQSAACTTFTNVNNKKQNPTEPVVSSLKIMGWGHLLRKCCRVWKIKKVLKPLILSLGDSPIDDWIQGGKNIKHPSQNQGIEQINVCNVKTWEGTGFAVNKGVVQCMAFKFNLISSHSTPFWYHRRNRVEPQSWTTARERIISLCCPLWGWGTHSQFCGWLWRRYNLHMGIILYVGYRVPASPLASLREKLRLILQMQPNQTKPNQTCGSCFTAAVWSHWRDSGLSPTRKANSTNTGY